MPEVRQLGRPLATISRKFPAAYLEGSLSSEILQGIIHRDLKPGNVMLVAASGGGTQAKVLDFGIAKVATNDFTELGTADGKSVLGTLAFMAPEQFMTPSLVSGQADVYSLGIMLHLALSGSFPFFSAAQGQGAQLFAYYRMHSEQAPPALPEHVPSAVAQLLAQMLAKSPAARPTMMQVATRLGELTSGSMERAGASLATMLAVPAPRAKGEPRREPAQPAETQSTVLVRPARAGVFGVQRWQLAPLVVGGGLLLGAFLTALLRIVH